MSAASISPPAVFPHWLGVQTLLPAVLLIAGVYLIMQLRGAFGRRLQIERKPLMTPAEVRFWHRLEAAVPDHRISCQVSMGALLKPVRGLSRQDWWRNYGRFSQKIVDFVVVDRGGEVVAVVELDDASHSRSNDANRDALLGRGGYRILRFEMRCFPSVTDIRSRFALGGAEGPVTRSRVEQARLWRGVCSGWR